MYTNSSNYNNNNAFIRVFANGKDPVTGKIIHKRLQKEDKT
jgi:hypothetical protein